MVKTIHFVVAFWGEVYAKAFSEYLMPSLLAPNNLPKLLDAPDVEGVLFICTTIADLDRISNNLIYAKLKEFVDIEFIDIGERPIERAPSLHMSYGHKLAISEVIKRKGYLSMLSPDAILADGSVATVIEHVSRGKRCILFPALRFDEQKCVSELSGRGYLKTDEIINISCRELVDVGLDNMHSWQKTFEFDKPYFSNVAIMAYFPLPDLGIAVFHASWGIAAADLGSLPLDYLSDLDADTIDGHFIDRCFFAPEHDRVPKLLSDSDDFFMLPLTPGETMSCEHLMSEYEGEGSPQYMNDIKLLNIRIFVGSFMSNDFKRWAYKEPSILHKGELNEAARSRISSKTDIILKAIEDPEEGPPVHFHLFANSMQEVAAINTVTFPSLLTRHNLGSKHISKGSSLTIYGEPSAFIEILNNPILERVKSLVHVDLATVSHPSKLNAESLRDTARAQADEAGAFLVWLGPFCYSAMVIEELLKRLEAGVACVEMVIPPMTLKPLWQKLREVPRYQWLYVTGADIFEAAFMRSDVALKLVDWDAEIYDENFGVIMIVDHSARSASLVSQSWTCVAESRVKKIEINASLERIVDYRRIAVGNVVAERFQKILFKIWYPKINPPEMLALCKARSLIANATIEGREVRQRLKKIAYFSADPDVDPLDDKAFVKLLDVVQQLFSATQADWTAADKAMKETYTHRYLMLSYVGRFVKYNIFLQVIIFVGFYFGIASRLIHLIHEVFHRDSETEAFTQYILRIVRYVFNDPGNLLRRVYHRLRQDVRGL